MALDSYLAAHNLALIPRQSSYRAVVTRSPISKGSVIIESPPLCSFPTSSVADSICNHCFNSQVSSSHSLMRCSRCKSALYCSVRCQRKAWNLHHKWLCDGIITNNTNGDYEMLRRVCLVIGGIAKKEYLTDYDVLYETFGGLMDHKNDYSQDMLEYFNHVATAILNELSSIKNFNKNNFTTNNLVSFLCIFGCNNFTVHDNQIFPVGEGTYPVGSLFNHSCYPNAVVMYHGNVQVIKAIEDISSNDEVMISYIDTANTKTTRQQLLTAKYYFDCECIRCNDNVPLMTFEDVDHLLVPASSTMPTTLLLELSTRQKTLLSPLLPSLFTIPTSIPPTLLPSLLSQPHTPLTLLSQHLSDLLRNELWDIAAGIGYRILAIYVLCYPRYHPMIGLHLYTMAKCFWNSTSGGRTAVEEAVKLSASARAVLEVSYKDCGKINWDVINAIDDLSMMALKELNI